LDLDRAAAWLARRAGSIKELRVGLGYPDALLALPQLLPPLAPALRVLELQGAASREWVHVEADLRWIRQV
jgi:hypothetical protein